VSQAVTVSLDNKSSTIHHPSNPTYRDYLLRDLTVLYARAYDYYIGAYSSDMSFSQKRFINCHSQAVFARNKQTGYVRVLARSCHLRFCPICNQAREKLIRHNVVQWLETKSYPKFLTLTLKHTSDDLRAQIDKLYRCFRALRRLRLVKQRVQSGIWFFQITRGRSGTEWHPHLHCILTGGYLPKTTLQRDWMRITGESFMVDIRLIRDVKSASFEVARYSAQACNIKTLNCDEMFDLDCALKRRRICGTWGSARKQRLTSSPKYDSNQWTVIGSWSAVIGCMFDDAAAREIYAAWKAGTPLAADVSVDYLDDFVKGLPVPDEVMIE
jgi:hypothetical protein